MNFIQLLASIGLMTGLFVLLDISPIDIGKNVFNNVEGKKKSLKDELDEVTNRKKVSFIKREVIEIKGILQATGRGHLFPQISVLASAFFLGGASLAILLGNWFLVPVMAFGFMLMPFWYIKLTQVHFKKQIAAELETALSIITTGYLRTENIVTAIEESVGYLNPPIHAVFKEFLYRVKMVNPDIVVGLQDMKSKVSNPVFVEWIDALILCQQDRTLKNTLNPITNKLSDMRIVNAELETLVTAPRGEYLTMVALVLCNIPLLYFLNIDWYNNLMHTIVGQIVLAICGTAIFVSLAAVIKLTQPIEYRR